jgi:hypothetical protein
MSDVNINAEDFGSTWGILLTYNTPEEREAAIESLEQEFPSLRIHSSTGRISEARLVRGAVNCVDISGQAQVLTGDEDIGQEVMGWIKSRRVVILCKEWEWSLLSQRNGRWMSHLDEVKSVSSLEATPQEAVSALLDEERIRELPHRLVVYEYLRHRELFTRFLNTIGADQSALQSLVDRKGLSSLDEDEQDLLLHSNEEIYRYLCGHELSSRGGVFNRQEFRDLFGEIPFRIGFGVDVAVFDDIIDELSEYRCTSIEDFGTVELLASLLTTEDAESRLDEDSRNVLEEDAQSLLERLENIENRDSLIQKGEYIAQYVSEDGARQGLYALLSSVGLVQLHEEDRSPLRLMRFYHSSDLTPEFKSHVSRLLAQMMEDEQFNQQLNYKKIAEFLSGQGPKLVLLLDGLPLTQDSSVEFLDRKTSDERWEVGFGVAPPLSNTETFREGLASSYDFSQLGGFTQDGTNLAHTDLDDIDDWGDRVINLLNRDESVIVYDSGIDRSGRHLADIQMKVDRYWSDKINEFINRFRTYADILIVSDHGLVKTYQELAISTPDDAGKNGLQHCRPCFTNEPVTSERAEDLDISQLQIQMPESGEECTMLNPNLPHARFGTQQGDRWTHSGISIEESIVPFVIRRRSS